MSSPWFQEKSRGQRFIILEPCISVQSSLSIHPGDIKIFPSVKRCSFRFSHSDILEIILGHTFFLMFLFNTSAVVRGRRVLPFSYIIMTVYLLLPAFLPFVNPQETVDTCTRLPCHLFKSRRDISRKPTSVAFVVALEERSGDRQRPDSTCRKP